MSNNKKRTKEQILNVFTKEEINVITSALFENKLILESDRAKKSNKLIIEKYNDLIKITSDLYKELSDMWLV